MDEIIQGVSKQVGQFLPNIASAIGVLIIGWIVAHLLGRIARIAVSKTGVDNKISRMLGKSSTTDMSRVIGKVVFYIVMLFVFVTFFNVLDLSVVSAPLGSFLDKIFAFAPQAISAIVLGIIAWALATVGRMGSRTALETIDIDGRLSALGQGASSVASTATAATQRVLAPDESPIVSLDDEDDEGVLDLDTGEELIDDEYDDEYDEPMAHDSTANSGDVQLSKTLPDAVYWLILFLFLPAILGALNMPGLLEPIQGMFEKALGYLPNIIGAGVILAIGFLVAKIIRQVVTNLTASFGVDRLGSKVGLVSDGSQTKLSGILGVLAYATVLLPILVAALNTLQIEAVTRPASAVLEQITAAIPGLIGGTIVLAISFFVAKLIAGIGEDVLSGVGFNELPTKLGIASAEKMKSTPSNLAGKALTVVIMLLATMQALPMMGLQSFAGHLDQFIGFGTQVLVGLVILGLGIYLANMAAGFVRDSGVEGADKLAIVARVAIIIFAGAMGLERMGLSTSIVNVAFSSLLGGLGIAAAIAFGWGGRDAAKRILDRYID